MQNNRKKYPVCSLTELKESKSLGIEINHDNVTEQYLLIYHENSVHSYLNRCPHTGVNLEWMPNQFLDTSEKFIQCSTHGALFKIEDGFCLRGPCIGDKLKFIDNCVEKDNIYLIL